MTTLKHLICCSGSLVLCASLTSAFQAPAVRLSAEPEKNAIVLHEPVYMNVTVTNEFDEEVRGSFRSDTLQLLIRQQAGVPVRVTERRSSRELTGGITPDGNNDVVWKMGLRPRETYRMKILLNEYFSFPSAGNYSIEIRTPTNFSLSSSKSLTAQPSVLSLEVKARDESRLQTIATTLTASVLSSSQSKETRIADAHALSYIEDPIAIPFFRRVLQETTDSQTRIYMIEGLARVQSAEAVEALISSLSNPNLSVRSYTRAILQRRLASTSDENLSKPIREALNQ